MNYDIEMEKQISLIKEKKKTLLLHACCAPCSSAVIERLMSIFKITIFFYNPNITSREEYDKRLIEMKRFLREFKSDNNIELIEGKYDKEVFLKMSEGLENEKERGPRCYKCYELRLKETAKQAQDLRYDFFTTTLSLSPYKNSDWINELGKKYSDIYKVDFLYSDFKKKDGYKRSIELSKKYNLYRQNYCGCVYSKGEVLNG